MPPGTMPHGLPPAFDLRPERLALQRCEAEKTVFRLQGDPDVRRQVVRHQRRQADAEIDDVAVLYLKDVAVMIAGNSSH